MIKYILLAFFTLVLFAPSFAMAENMLSRFLRSVFNEPAGPQPHDTLQAPFPTDGATPAGQSDLMKIYDERTAQTASATAADKPHMTAHALREWVMQAVTNALTFDPQDAELGKKRAGFFEPYAMTEFQNWVGTSGIAQSLGNGTYTLRAVLSSDPTLLSEGTLNGTYRWVFDVPVIISYVPRGTTTLKTAPAIPQSQKLTLRVQVGRLSNPDDRRVLIERWATAP